jgi:hypothetical protein
MFRNIYDCLWSKVCCNITFEYKLWIRFVYLLGINTFVCCYCHDNVLESFNSWQGLIPITRKQWFWCSKFWDVNECYVAKYKVNVLKFIRTNLWLTFELPFHLRHRYIVIAVLQILISCSYRYKFSTHRLARFVFIVRTDYCCLCCLWVSVTEDGFTRSPQVVRKIRPCLGLD